MFTCCHTDILLTASFYSNNLKYMTRIMIYAPSDLVFKETELVILAKMFQMFS